MSIMRFLGSFRACNGFSDIFMTTPEKWLELAYIVLICDLYDGVGAADARVYHGRFTFYFKVCLSEKPIVDVFTRSLKF